MTVKIVTTLHQDGYNLYGSNIQTWARHFPKVWQIEYYAEKHSPVLDNRITVKDFDTACPEWHVFYKHILEAATDLKDKKKLNWYRKALRWSFKMFVTIDALKNSDTRYVIWLDSDVVAKDSPSKNWIENSLKGSAFAGKFERIKHTPHIESGILIFDKQHQDTDKIVEWLELGYIQKHILFESKAWDGFWLGKLAVSNTVSWNNINLFSPTSFLKHCVGDDKFDKTYSGRSGRTKANELI